MTGKRDKPLALDMPFGEAFERFSRIDYDDLPDQVRLKRKTGSPKRPPSGEQDGPKPD